MRISRHLSTLCGLSASALSLLALATAPVHAQQLVYDNGSYGTAGGFDIGDYAVADDFSFTGTTSFDSIRFWAFDGFAKDNSLSSFSGTLSYFVRADNGGKPGAALISGTVSGAAITKTDTGVLVFNVTPILQLDVSIPEVTLDAGTYWLQLKEGTLSSAYDGTPIVWTVSANHTGSIQLEDDNEVNPTGWGLTTFYDAAFQLRNTASAATAAPEPSSFALLGMAGLPIVGMVIRRRKAA